jgi:hypothetical protein
VISLGANLASTGGPPRRSRAWWLIVTGRVLLLAVAAAAAVFALTQPSERPAGRDAARTAAPYRCPMHPDVTSPSPGECPICRMPLARDGTDDGAATAPLARAQRRVFSEDLRAHGWADTTDTVAATLYRDDLVGLAPGQPARWFPAGAPQSGIDVTLTADPPTDWDDATTSVRCRVAVGTPLRPGEPGLLVMASLPRELLVIPAAAVVHTPEGPHVFAIDPHTHRLHRLLVRLGRAHPGVVSILAGLHDGQWVVTTGAFFLDAERHLHPEGAP